MSPMTTSPASHQPLVGDRVERLIRACETLATDDEDLCRERVVFDSSEKRPSGATASGFLSRPSESPPVATASSRTLGQPAPPAVALSAERARCL
jgi:hypothetical protein